METVVTAEVQYTALSWMAHRGCGVPNPACIKAAYAFGQSSTIGSSYGRSKACPLMFNRTQLAHMPKIDPRLKGNNSRSDSRWQASSAARYRFIPLPLVIGILDALEQLPHSFVHTVKLITQSLHQVSQSTALLHRDGIAIPNTHRTNSTLSVRDHHVFPRASSIAHEVVQIRRGLLSTLFVAAFDENT